MNHMTETHRGNGESEESEEKARRERRRRARKERVLHTRISEELSEDIRRMAEELRVPVSKSPGSGSQSGGLEYPLRILVCSVISCLRVRDSVPRPFGSQCKSVKNIYRRRARSGLARDSAMERALVPRRIERRSTGLRRPPVAGRVPAPSARRHGRSIG